MAYEITYNNFGSAGSAHYQWDRIRVQNYQSTPLFEEDTQSHWTTQHTLSGTALLTTSDNLDTVIDNARTKLQKVGRNLFIQLDDVTIVDVGNNTFNKSSGIASTDDTFEGKSDTAGYPRCTFEINKFYGSQNAMVSFTFVWHETKIDTVGGEDAQTNWSVLSHQWRQRFSIAEDGLQTWTVEGTLHTRPWDTPDCGSGANYGRNPDSYRRLVMPGIPTNFRVKRMDWATDKTGEKLIYSIVMQEHARGLPVPARRGTGSYRFKKSLDAQGGLLGDKIFDAELEGDAKSDPRLLLGALLDASQARIRWAGTGKDLITSIEVRESDIFSKKLIGLRVSARGMPDEAQSERLTGVPLSGINFGIFEDFVPENAELATSPDVYGSALIGSFKKQIFLPYAAYNVSDFPRAQLLGAPGSETTSTNNLAGGVTIEQNECIPAIDESVYLIDTTADVVIIPSPDEGEFLAGDENEQSEEDEQAKYLNVRGVERVGLKTHIQAFSTYGNNPVHLPWQTGLPSLYIESEYTLTRLSAAPPMIMFKIPKNFIVINEQTSIEAGELDSNGNRMFTRLIKRKIQMLYGHTDDNWEENVLSQNWSVGGINVTLQYKYPTMPAIHRPYDARVDGETSVSENTIFDGTGADAFYPVEFSLPIGL
jgi:hypothetical protein